MKNGFIYDLTNALVRALNYLNLVELFKVVAVRLTPQNADPDTVRHYKSIAIDIFIVLKWGVVACLWYLAVSNFIARIVVFYLIFTNVYTYFLNHVWDDNPHKQQMTVERAQRRFVSLMLAVAFSTFAYAYLYRVGYATHFEWSTGFSPLVAALHFSVSNSIGGSFDGVSPLDNVGSLLTASQQIISFVFLAVILTKSIPESK